MGVVSNVPSAVGVASEGTIAIGVASVGSSAVDVASGGTSAVDVASGGTSAVGVASGDPSAVGVASRGASAVGVASGGASARSQWSSSLCRQSTEEAVPCCRRAITSKAWQNISNDSELWPLPLRRHTSMYKMSTSALVSFVPHSPQCLGRGGRGVYTMS